MAGGLRSDTAPVPPIKGALVQCGLDVGPAFHPLSRNRVGVQAAPHLSEVITLVCSLRRPRQDVIPLRYT